MRKPFYLPILIISLTLTSCSTIMNNIPGVYSIDIEQGNIINQDMVDQLRPKMTKRQVLYIMGSSMLVDVFHQKRWDYIYSEQPGGKPRRQKRLSLFFDGDELMGVQGDFRPSSLPVITKSYDTTVEVPKRDLDRTLWGKMKRLWTEDEPRTLEQLNGENSIVTESNNEKTETTSEDESSGVIDEPELLDEESDNTTPITETPDTETDIDDTPEKEDSEVSTEPLEEEKPQELEEIQN
ncbi:MAG: outer membrane protein assembly factor BamE [Methylococcales bacterium]|nr:outer membrane protein assembly factor BamE [Methylococcales bacterium]